MFEILGSTHDVSTIFVDTIFNLTMNCTSYTQYTNSVTPDLALNHYSTTNSLRFVVLVMIGAGLLSIVTVTGNLLIILAYYKNEKIRSISNVPILSLAFTDMFIGFFPVTMNILEMALGYWPLGRVMCNVSLVLDYVSIQSSINHIILINYDRYLSIKSPMKHRLHQKTSRVFVKLLIIWILALALWAPYINFYKYTARNKNFPEKLCYKQFSMVNDVEFKKYFFVITSILGYFIPLGIVVVIYGKMYLIIRRQLYNVPKLCQSPGVAFSSVAETAQWHQVSSSLEGLQENYGDIQKNLELLKRRKRILRHKKALRMIASIISAFVVTGLPLNAQWLFVGMCNSCYNRTLFEVFNFFTYPNSTVNPFLYAYVSKSFRLQFKKFLFCGFCQKLRPSPKEKIGNRYCVKNNAKEQLNSEST